MLVTYDGICSLVEDGVVEGASLENVNAASLDVRLGDVMWLERTCERGTVDLTAEKAEGPSMFSAPLDDQGKWVLLPGQWALFETVERFNLRDDLALEFKLRSSMARAGLDHALAGWGDPGWNNATLTLELRNNCLTHSLQLAPGMRVGQVVFWLGAPVPEHASYAKRGRYNGQRGAQGTRGHGQTAGEKDLEWMKMCIKQQPAPQG